MPRITMQLQVKERDALFRLAQLERRKPQDQAALFVSEGLERRGLLPTDQLKPAQPQPATPAQPQPTEARS